MGWNRSSILWTPNTRHPKPISEAKPTPVGPCSGPNMMTAGSPAAPRLTLNVLLSFAQFEREVTSERIRDKIAASKRKGLWVGGMAPLGYDTKDRKISINQAEADRVRTIFRNYLKLGSLGLLMADLRTKGIVTKVRTLKTGETVGGIAFTRGPLAHVLRNRFYIGQITFEGEVLAGEQPALVDRDLFEAVHAKLAEQVTNHEVSRTRSEALLLGRIYDDRGHRMTPSHVRKRGIKYRYYISSALLQGRPKQAGTVSRVPAFERVRGGPGRSANIILCQQVAQR
jgi:site-specific DNA recombinase